jgi:hypothetical protein
MGDVPDLLRQALSGVEPSQDALARTLDRARRRERRRRIVVAGTTVLVLLAAGTGLLVTLDGGDRAGSAGQPESPATTSPPAVTPTTASQTPALFLPATRRQGHRTVLPVTFPDGSTAELVYPANLDLAGMGIQPDVSIVDDRRPGYRSPLVFLHRGTPGPDVLEGAQPVQRPASRTGRPTEIWKARQGSEVAPDQAYWVLYRVSSWTVLAPAADLTAATELAGHLDLGEAGDGSVVVDADAPLGLSHDFGEGGGVQLAIGDRAPRPGEVDAGRLFRLILLSPMTGSCRGAGLSRERESASKCLRGPGGRGAILVTISGDRRFVEAVFDGLELKEIHLAS